MKKLVVPFLLLLLVFLSPLLRRGAGGEAFSQYSSQNISLLSHWDTATVVAEPIYNIRYNSVWGWVDPQDQKEYAILGSTSGTYFIDVSNPLVPKVRAFVAGRRDSCVWREYKTYDKYLYAVSDDQPPNSLQIIDMSGLPNSVQVVYDSDTLITRSHTVFIDGDKLYGGYVNTPSDVYNMAVYSLANPALPQLIRPLNLDFSAPNGSIVHDMYVRNDTVYASFGFDGLYIFKFNGSSFTQLGSLTNYASYGQGYNHSSALTANGKTLIFTDEVPANLPVKSLNVSDFGNLTMLDTFLSTPTTSATPHNPFIRKGDNSRVIVAYYQDGLQIFDITNPANVTRTGFFDTAPNDCPACPNPNYSGCWGAYVDLPSGIILASDMQAGLFVLDANAAGMGVTGITHSISATIFPNPFTDDFQINLSLLSGEKITCELTDITGKKILKKTVNAAAGNTIIPVDGKTLSAGAYILSLKGEKVSLTKKLIKTNQ